MVVILAAVTRVVDWLVIEPRQSSPKYYFPAEDKRRTKTSTNINPGSQRRGSWHQSDGPDVSEREDPLEKEGDGGDG